MKSIGGESEQENMRLFSKNTSNKADTLPEVDEYYHSGEKEHKAIAWLLAFATFFVTLVVFVGIFFGGKWVFKKISTRKDTAKQTQSVDSNNTKKQSNETGASKGGDTGQSQGGQNNSGPQTSSTSTSTPSAPTSTTPPPSRLVNTGPDEDL